MFIGLENINPANLIAAKKRQNKITEYRKMLLEWKRYGIMTFAGYILGFPNDTPESIRHDLEIIKRELPLDMLEFFVLTPLPGSEDHKVLAEKGVWMDPDMNKYELEHVVTAHAKMSKDEWQDAYRTAWGIFYTDDHLEHGAAPRLCQRHQHPLADAGAVLVLERGAGRRMCIPCNGACSASRTAPIAAQACRIESPIVFYAPLCRRDRRARPSLLAKRWRELKRIVRKIEADPNAKSYMDERDDAGGGGRFRAYGALHPERGGAHRGRARAAAWPAKPGNGTRRMRGTATGTPGNGHDDHDAPRARRARRCPGLSVGTPAA